MGQFMGKDGGDLLVGSLQHQAEPELDHAPVRPRVHAAFVVEKLRHGETFMRR